MNFFIPNYSRNLELAKYKLNESAVFEADADPAKALEQVKSGKNGGAYANQWNQVQTAVVAGYEAGKTSGTIMVKHDASIGGADMVNVAWSITNGNVSLSLAKEVAKVQSTADVKKAADQILKALVGNFFDENEELVYSTFRDDIKSDADLKALLTYWKSQHAAYVPGYSFSSFADVQAKSPSAKSTDATVSLEWWLGMLFNAEEINKVNDYISKYSTFRFKAR